MYLLCIRPADGTTDCVRNLLVEHGVRPSRYERLARSLRPVSPSGESLVSRRQGPYISSCLRLRRFALFACEAVDLDFLDTAPVRLGAAVSVGRPPSEVFAALTHDPANWGEFFPGFGKTGRYHTPEPHGVDSRRAARFTGLKFEETILAWDEGARWAFRVDSVQAPLFDACVEDYHFEPDRGDDATVLRWTIAYKPRLAFKLVGPVLPRVLPLLLTRAGHNLEHGRWFSKP